jgi:hypothetical protein
MSLAPGPNFSLVDESARLMGHSLQFHCFDCHEQVDEVTVCWGMEFIRTPRFYLRCHERSTMVDIPMDVFTKVPRWGSSPNDMLRFVVGFGNGTWSVRLRNYDWLLREPHLFYTAAGNFYHHTLERLFEFQVLGGFHLDSEFFNIVNLEHNFEFPAEFWFPTARQRIFAKQSGLQV